MYKAKNLRKCLISTLEVEFKNFSYMKYVILIYHAVNVQSVHNQLLIIERQT